VKSQVVNVTEFKAKCLALLDEIGKNGGAITVTKRGRPLALIGPAPKRRRKSSEGAWIGKVEIPNAVLMADRSDLWEIARGK
jgi:prevent-host-death family protein